MNQRLRLIRESKELSRSAFGQRIGVSGDVINNLERGRVEIKEHIIKLVCSEYSINEKWFRFGIGQMNIQTPSSTMEQLRKEFNLDDFSYNLVYEYLKLDIEQRDAFREFFYRVIHAEDNMVSTTADAEAAYEKSLGIASSTDSTALSTTDGTGENENRDVG